jgi:hypothetical protein
VVVAVLLLLALGGARGVRLDVEDDVAAEAEYDALHS